MLNFNVDPYYDDFDPSKNFHRILFKPGAAVQARELTQSQTILQNQISNFADNIFSQNTPVTGGKVTVNLNCSYIKLNRQYSGQDITVGQYNNLTILGGSNGFGTIVARVIATAEATGTDANPGDPPTLIVSYSSGVQFTDGLTLYVAGTDQPFATTIGTLGGTTCTGLSSVASISNGVFYVVNGWSLSNTPNPDGSYSKYSIGNFVSVQSATVILSKYTNVPSLRVGLTISELITDYINDVSLLDPSLGSSNFQGPGADRYTVTLTLSTLPLTLGNDSEFISLVSVQDGKIIKQVDGTVYSVINDYFAKRDYETNGDYVVEEFKLTPTANTADSTKYDMGIGPGVAYAHGYRLDNQSPLTITSDRARSTTTINNNAVYIDYGNYYVVNSIGGTFDVGVMPQVDFHCVNSENIVTANSTSYSSSLVGSGFLRNLTYVTGTGSNTKSYVYNAFVSDLSTTTLTGTVTSATTNTITLTDVNNKFSATANAYYGVTATIASGVDVGDTLSIISYTVSGNTRVFTFNKNFIQTPSASDTFTLLYTPSDVDSIVYVPNKTSSYISTANCNINTSYGRMNGVVTGGSILNTTGAPELLYDIGYPFIANVASTSYYSTRIYRDKTFTSTTLTLSATSGSSSSPLRFEGTGVLSGSAAEQNFIVIDRSSNTILDFTSSGNTINVSADHTYATLTSSTYSGKTVDVIASVQVSSGDSSLYILKSKSLITGNTSSVATNTAVSGASTTAYNLTAGQVFISRSTFSSNTPMSLYVTDIKNIVKVYDSGSPTVVFNGNPASYTDITGRFTLNNGQRDSYYDFGSISLIPGAPVPLGNILVIFNYYSHSLASSGDGYFSVSSYQAPVSSSPESYAQIPTYTATNGNVYKLSDVVDFRPSRANGQTAYIWEFSQTQAYNNDVGVLLPNNLSNFTNDYSYYLARKDKLILTKDNSFRIIEGTPSINPSFPSEPDGSIVLANLSLDPYTAYVPGENPPGVQANLSVNKVSHKRWAKSDITTLESRVNNLEYYTSLNLLEQNAQSLQVPDVNGLNRFKNGILVDDFSSYSTADTTNADFVANINIRNKQLGPLTIVRNYQLQNPTTLKSLGTVSNTGTYAISSINGTQTNLFTLPYTTANVIIQPLATSSISINPFAVTVYQGIASLSPPMDNWVDNSQAPPVLITDPTLHITQVSNGLNLLNAGDFATIPGTSSISSSSDSSVNQGAFSAGTYTSVLQNLSVTAGTSANPSAFNTTNGYITNNAILPYIRPQEIIVKAKGMLINTPVHTWFDGINVDTLMTAPNTIELVNASGMFNEDDIVGVYSSAFNTYYPMARVISVYNYPNGTSVRLYVSEVVNPPTTIVGGSTLLQNMTFDGNGNRISGNTGNGTLVNSSIYGIHYSGSIAGVGGTYTTKVGTAVTGNLVLSPVTSSYPEFLNNYGVWGDSNQSTYYSASFPFTVTANGTCSFYASCCDKATILLNGGAFSNTVVGSSNGIIQTTSDVAINETLYTGITYNVSWTAYNNTGGPSAFALTVIDSSNSLVFDSVNPPNLRYNGVGGSNNEIVMSGGGAWFTGITSLILDANASSNANFYLGSTISVTSTLVYDQTVAATYTPPAYVPPPYIPPAPVVITSPVIAAIPITPPSGDAGTSPYIWFADVGDGGNTDSTDGDGGDGDD